MQFNHTVSYSYQTCCFLFLQNIRFNFGRFVNIFLLVFLSSGGASAHSHRQPKEARSPALLRPRQNPGQQRSEHRLRARGHEPARWDKKYQPGTAGCVYQRVSHSAGACETDPISLWGLWKSYSYCRRRFMMHKPWWSDRHHFPNTQLLQ